MLATWSEFRRCQRGALALTFAMLFGVILLIGGGTLDYLRLVSVKMKMQSVIDAASIHSVQAINIAQADEAAISAIAKGYIAAYGEQDLKSISINVDVDLPGRRVKITKTTPISDEGAVKGFLP